MTSNQTKEEILFNAARALSDPKQRAAFLDAACQGDSELRRGLEELLAAEARAEVFFDKGPQDQDRVAKGQCPRCGGALPADVVDGLCPKELEINKSSEYYF